MKRLSVLTAGIVGIPALITFSAVAYTLPPGQVDFGSFTSSSNNGDFVEVNVTSSLITLATKFIEKQEPDVAKVLNGLKMVHVNVIGLNDGNRSDVEQRLQKVHQDLDGGGWERIVMVKQKDQDVRVYLKTQNKETVQGLVVTVMEGGKQVVFANVVGDIKPEQLSMIAERFNIEPLKHIEVPKAEKEQAK